MIAASLQITRSPNIALLHRVIVFAFIIFPLFGTFYPPESYFQPATFSISDNVDRLAEFYPIGRYTTYALLLFVMMVYARHFQSLLGTVAEAWLPLCFIAVLMASVLLSPDLNYSFNRAMKIAICYGIIIYFIQNVGLREMKSIIVQASVFMIICHFFASIAIPTYGLSNLNGDYSNAWRGATGHKNSLGAASSFLLVFALDQLLVERRNRSVAIFVLFGSLLLIILSRSATNAFSTVGCVCVYMMSYFVSMSKNPIDKILLVSIMLVFVLLSSVVVYYADDILSLVGRSSDFTGRSAIWDAVSRLCDERPVFGWGYGFWQVVSPARNYIWTTLNWAPPSAHNTFLDCWLQLGIAGLIICVALFVSAIRLSLKVLMHRNSSAALLWIALPVNLMIRCLTETQFLDSGGLTLSMMIMSLVGLKRTLHRNREVLKSESSTA